MKRFADTDEYRTIMADIRNGSASLADLENAANEYDKAAEARAEEKREEGC